MDPSRGIHKVVTMDQRQGDFSKGTPLNGKVGKSSEPRKKKKRGPLLGCPGQEVNGSMVRIDGLFHLLINGVYWGYSTCGGWSWHTVCFERLDM